MTTLTDTQVITASGGLVELGYSQITSSVTIDNATAGTGKEVISPLTVVCDGGPILVEFCSPGSRPSTTGGDSLTMSLFMDGSEYVRTWGIQEQSGAGSYGGLDPVHLQRRVSPAAGSHTFGVKAYVTNASRTGAIGAGDGTTTGTAPAFLRVSKIVQATQWPAVTTGTIICTSTTRPASPFEGQTIYETDTDRKYLWTGSAWVIDGGLTLITKADVSASTTLNVNNCFSSAFKNYRIISDGGVTASATGGVVSMRLRSGGTNTSTDHGYMEGKFASSVAAFSGTGLSSWAVGFTGYNTANSRWGVFTCDLFDPFGSAWTHFVSSGNGVESGGAEAGGRWHGSHRVASSYDGFSLSWPAAITTTVRVYGYNNG